MQLSERERVLHLLCFVSSAEHPVGVAYWSNGFGTFCRNKRYSQQGRESPDFKQSSRSDSYTSRLNTGKKGSALFICGWASLTPHP